MRTVAPPIAIDLFCGLGGWTEGLLAEGYDVTGYDIEAHEYGDARYPAKLVLADVLTLHGSQFKDAALIVASPPCQAYSYMAMPWKKGKAIAAGIRADMTGAKLDKLNQLFNACFRIQREACEAAGHHIPMVVENVRGAQPWVGRAQWNFGSFYLWGDVPALMPIAKSVKVTTMGAGWYPPDHPKHVPGLAFNGHAERNLKEGQKNPGFRFDGSGKSFQTESVERHTKNNGGSWFAVAHNTTSGKGQNPDGRKTPGAPHIRDGESHTAHLTNTSEHVKQGGDWFNVDCVGSISRRTSSKSKARKARKAASATIAKIPLVLARWIGATYKPEAR